MPTAAKAKSTMSGLNGIAQCWLTLERSAIHQTDERRVLPSDGRCPVPALSRTPLDGAGRLCGTTARSAHSMALPDVRRPRGRGDYPHVRAPIYPPPATRGNDPCAIRQHLKSRLKAPRALSTAGPLQCPVCLKPLTDRQKVCRAKMDHRPQNAAEVRSLRQGIASSRFGGL
jgi:hypothetical protein